MLLKLNSEKIIDYYFSIWSLFWSLSFKFPWTLKMAMLYTLLYIKQKLPEN